jgi:signal peptide peptidase SppA
MILPDLLHPSPVVTVLRLHGAIGGHAGPLRSGLSLSSLAGVIERAFQPRRLAAVALVINSPGGSPVQSSLIGQRIRALADEKSVPVIAFAEDMAASGGYWLAMAADELYVDESSIIGSIGVISAGFGFPSLLERLGVERRVYAQGERKAMLDPFRPEDADDVARVKALQADIHEAFKALVRRRRAGRLKAPEEQLFNGDVWTGRRAVELGLADGIGEVRQVMRARFGDKVRLRAVATPKSWLRRQLKIADPSEWAEALLDAVEQRALWRRFGG